VLGAMSCNLTRSLWLSRVLTRSGTASATTSLTGVLRKHGVAPLSGKKKY
jgi:hypothetical protein